MRSETEEGQDDKEEGQDEEEQDGDGNARIPQGFDNDDDDGAMAQRRPSGPSAQGIGTPSTTHKASFDDTHGSLTTHTAHQWQVSPNKDAYGPSTRHTAPITPFDMTQPPVPPIDNAYRHQYRNQPSVPNGRGQG
jgi:hypothetical protein